MFGRNTRRQAGSNEMHQSSVNSSLVRTLLLLFLVRFECTEASPFISTHCF